MKICFLTHNLRQDNGTGVFSKRLIWGIKEKLGADVIILTTAGSNAEFEKPILHANKLKLITEIFRIRRIFKSCDVIHPIDVFPFGIVAVIASFGLKKKIIMGTLGSGAVIPLYSWFYVWITKLSYRKADMVIAVSDFMKKEILKKVPNLKIDIINPGVDIEYCPPGKDFDGRVAGKKPYMLSVGSLRWRKGYKVSIQAFSIISKRFPDLNYVIIGKKYSDKYFNQISKMAEDLGVEKKIFFLTDIDDQKELKRFYCNAEIFCLMSLNVRHELEGFGMVYLEAAMSGLPIVSSLGSGVEDSVNNGKNGILVSQYDYRAVANAVIKILSDNVMKEKMSKASLEWVKNFEWEDQIQKYLTLYDELKKGQ